MSYGSEFTKIGGALDALENLLPATDAPYSDKVIPLWSVPDNFDTCSLDFQVKSKLAAGLLLEISETLSNITAKKGRVAVESIRLIPDAFPNAFSLVPLDISGNEVEGDEEAFIEIDENGFRFVCQDSGAGERAVRFFERGELKALMEKAPAPSPAG